jgi:hypothetical protein
MTKPSRCSAHELAPNASKFDKERTYKIPLANGCRQAEALRRLLTLNNFDYKVLGSGDNA